MPTKTTGERWRGSTTILTRKMGIFFDDVVEEDLHMDLLFENKDDEVDDHFPEHTPPPYKLGSTVKFCVNYLKDDHEQLIRDYKDDLNRTR